jgi:hypothetical protein
LLLIAVAVASTITSRMVSRNPENPGFLITKWVSILQTIGSDTADDLQSANQSP